MPEYYVNREMRDGDHEVHKEGCSHPPNIENRVSLGNFTNCHDAVAKAKKIYPTADGCKWCSEECHTK